VGQTEERFRELALALVYDRLSSRDKKEVHRLIVHCPDFVSILREEIMLVNQLQVLKKEVPEAAKEGIYHTIIAASMGRSVMQALLRQIYKAVVPALPWPLEEIFERSVFVNE